MISEKVENILNSQINKEFYSAYLYLAMSAYFDEIGLYGFSNWTKILEHEIYVTESVNCVASLSENECDLATRHFINWYISEQVEEEANARDVITKLKMFGDDKASLYHLDQDLGKREYKHHSYKI